MLMREADGPDTLDLYPASGEILDRRNRAGLPHLRIEAWDATGACPDLVACAFTDAEGAFELSVSADHLRELGLDEGAALFFRVFKGAHQIADTRSSAVWLMGETGATFPLLVDTAAKHEGHHPAPFTVRGRLLDATRGPLAGHTVNVSDKNLGTGEAPLGHAVTDRAGHYEVQYTPDHLGRPGKHQADLVVRAFDPAGAPLVASDVICRAPPTAIVDLVAGGDAFRAPSEYEAISSELGPALGGVDPARLTEDDVRFLTCSTGADAAQLSAFVTAHQLAPELGLAPEVVYSLARDNPPPNRRALLAPGPATLRQLLQVAIDGNVVPAHLGASVDQAIEKIQRATVQLAFEPPAGTTEASLGDLLATVLPDRAQQEEILTASLTYQGTPQAFWQALAERPSFKDTKTVAALQYTLQIGALTGNNLPLVQKLQALYRAGTVTSLRDLARLDEADWLAMIGPASHDAVALFASGTGGAAPAAATQDARDLAASLAAILEEAFPTDTIAHRLAKDPALHDPDLVAFFASNPTFEVGPTRVGAYLAATPKALARASDPATLTRRLQGIERLFKFAPRWSDMRVLMIDGIHSAQGVARMGRTGFRKRYGAALVDVDAVFDGASWVHAAAQSLAARYQPAYNAVYPYVLRAKRDAEPAVGDYAALLAQLQTNPSAPADWPTLFGPLDFCTCGHCRSVYGPAAYLVDLLQFLDRHEAKTNTLVPRKKSNIFMSPQPVVVQTQKTARDVLLERRPDIANIELSCENTDTEIPYVDLVNEILAYAVANTAPPPNASFAFPTHIATIGTADELGAVPQPLPATSDPQPAGAPSVYDTAYGILSQVPYPHDLPFHVWAEEARVYFQHLGVPRYRLMETFPAVPPPAPEDVAAEYLGLAPFAWALITGGASTSLTDAWGLGAQDDPNVVLRAVPEFLKRSGGEYADLRELLDRRYVNPDTTVTIGVDPADSFADPTTCDVSKLRLLGGDATTFGGFLDRAQSFLRLRGVLGWTMVELDKTITAFMTDLSAGFLVTVSQIARLRTDLDVPLVEMLSWWSSIDIESMTIPQGSSLYAQLFLNRAVMNPPDAAFAPLPDESQALSAHTAAIGAALRIGSPDLALLLQAVIADDKLTLDNLSRLYRHVSLARALGLSARDLLVLEALTGLDPFDAEDVGTVRTFKDCVSQIQKARFTIAEVDYLVRHVALATSGVAPAIDAIDLVLDEIRSALDKLAAEATVPPNPTGELTARALLALLPVSHVIDLVAVVDGTSQKTAADQAAVVNDLGAFLTASEVQIIQANLLGSKAIATDKAAERFACVLGPVTGYLHATSLVKQRLSVALSIPPHAAASLLTQILTADLDASRRMIIDFLPAYTATRDQQRRSYVRLQKTAMLVSRLKLTPDELLWIAGAGWLDLNALPVAPNAAGQPLFGAWQRLVDFTRLRDSLRAGKAALLELLAMAATQKDTEGKPVDGKAYLAALADRTGWAFDDLAHLTGAFGLTFPASYVDERNLLSLKGCFDVLARIGFAAETVAPWAAADPKDQDQALDAARARAQAIKSAVKAKYDDAAWLTVARPLTDVVRDKQRVALVSYLAWKTGAQTTNDLLARYLVDVEMAPCQMTSRIAQAIGSVQLFVQRCFLHLEDEMDLPDEAADEWKKWRGRYRFWEANRKVFLYPENWIEPELRDDKTPFFEELETELVQHDLTSDRAEDAVRHYLEKLDQVARLDVAGVYHDTDGVDVLHVFGRTPSVPHVYFYRLRDGKAWSPWEKVDVDIAGDILLPVVWNRRLYLFWPILREVANDDQTANQPATTKKGLTPGKPATKHLEIQLAYSDYKNGKWSAKRITDGAPVTYMDVPENLFFTSEVDDSGDLHIRCLASHDAPQGDAGANGSPVTARTWLVGELLFTGCSGKNTSTTSTVPFPEVAAFRFPLGTTRDELDFVSSTGSAGAGYVPLLARRDEGGPNRPSPKGGTAPPKAPKPAPAAGLYVPPADWKSGDPVVTPDVRVLRKTPSGYRLAYSHQDEQFPALDSFVYEDKRRTFLVSANAEERVAWLPASLIPLPPFVSVGDRPGLPLPKTLRARATGASAQDRTGGADPTATVIGHVFTWNAYTFEVFYHPYACEFIRRLNRDGIDGLFDWKDPLPLQLVKQVFFKQEYDPEDGDVDGAVEEPYPIEDVDFSPGGACSIYNWELFFHVPLLIATRLSQNQRFEDAQRWFHFIFDPTTGSTAPVPSRFWKVRPFYEKTDLASIAAELTDLAQGKDTAGLGEQIAAWEKDPYNPHLVARMRLVAYQKTVVMKYIDNLIGWADQLFRRDTLEAINEATLLYVLASDILGPRPREIPPRADVGKKTYDELAQATLDDFSDPLVQIEGWTPPVPPGGGTGSAGAPELPKMLYFCVPPNETLLAYWDTVADRLFKIRHCMNIEGVVRQLPLFEPPIDPALLVQAAAAGVDIGSVLDDLRAPMPHYRFHVMIQKANELVAEARSLGTALLAAWEKRDAEELGRLRSTHEIAVLTAVRQVRAKQVDEAQSALDGLHRSRELVGTRHAFYANVKFMNAPETMGMALGGAAALAQLDIEAIQAGAAPMRPIPTVTSGGAGFASPVAVTTEAVGQIGAESAVDAGRVAMAATSYVRETGAMAVTMGSYTRRWDDWKLQENLAAKELEQIDAQIAAAKLRLAIAEKELANQDLQIDNARSVDDYLRSKFTSQELYEWTVAQTSAVYFQAYKLAYDVAQRVERAYRFERGLLTSSYIRFGYWDGLRNGLLAAERLGLDLKRLDMAYLEQNKREYEIVKSIPLSRHAPFELITLKETGVCSVRLPETLFDLDYPGHYMRRIKSVSLFIPNVSGAYTSVNCKLTLVGSKVRVDAEAAKAADYNSQAAGHVVQTFGALESIVTSTAQNDGGLFELNLRDERYLPFEGAGVISTWQIEMPKASNSFDFSTLTDVILRVSYTARDGGDALRAVAEGARREADPGFVPTQDVTKTLSDGFRFVRLREELYDEWLRFFQGGDDPAAQTFTLALAPRLFQPVLGNRKLQIVELHVFWKWAQAYEGVSSLKIHVEPPGETDNDGHELNFTTMAYGSVGHVEVDPAAKPWPVLAPGEEGYAPWVLTVKAADSKASDDVRVEPGGRLRSDAVQDVWLVCRYQGAG
jgi:hypothetical protein